MTNRLAIHVVDPRDPMIDALELHVRPGPEASRTVFGWEVVPPPVDAGPPPTVEETFAAALVRCGSVACLTYAGRALRSIPRHGWVTVGEDHWNRMSPTLVERLRDRPVPWMLATRDPGRACALFRGVSWEQQHQVGLLLRDQRLPPLTSRWIAKIMGARNARLGALRLPDEVAALVLPGVDGDVLELVAREQATLAWVHAMVAAECQRRGVTFDPAPRSCNGRRDIQ